MKKKVENETKIQNNVEKPTHIDVPRRLVTVGKPDWEKYIETLEYNMASWNANNWIVKHNIKLIKCVKHVQDYEIGKRADKPPFTLAELVNPKSNCRSAAKRNTGLDRTRYFFNSMKQYEPGHAPVQNYEAAFGTTRVLILLLKKCADYFGRRPEEQQLSRSLNALYDAQRFLQDVASTEPSKQISREEYDAKIDALCEKLVNSFMENTLLFETLLERRALAVRNCGIRKGTGRKGTRTSFMERQLETLQTFVLDGHPVTSRFRPATRAHQCWMQHRDEWDKHIHASGEEKGFSCPKSLARAYRMN